MMSRTPALTCDPTSHIESRRPSAACSSASAPTAPSARTRTPSRSSVKRPTTTPRATSYYDSKKSGTVTISHLRFGPKPIRAPYLIELTRRNFRCLPPVHLPRARGHAQVCQAGRHLPAQQPLRSR
ncbi:MAG: hypothetical protein MZV64_19030 [Ignavibacteriales bacterium]|nr:hypothetical protein [Ignavibacteriales bacterium]